MVILRNRMRRKKSQDLVIHFFCLYVTIWVRLEITAIVIGFNSRISFNISHVTIFSSTITIPKEEMLMNWSNDRGVNLPRSISTIAFTISWSWSFSSIWSVFIPIKYFWNHVFQYESWWTLIHFNAQGYSFWSSKLGERDSFTWFRRHHGCVFDPLVFSTRIQWSNFQLFDDALLIHHENEVFEMDQKLIVQKFGFRTL